MCNRVTRRVPHVEQELLSLPGHLCAPPVLVGFVLLDLQFSVQWFADPCLSFCHFSFSHCYLFFFDLRFCLYLNVDIFFFQSKSRCRSNKTSATCGAGTQWCSCWSIFRFVCNVLQTVIYPFVNSFRHCVICTSTYAFDYYFSIFKLFFHRRLYLVFY